MADCGCPEIDEADWEMVEHDWEGKTFYVVPVFMLFHIPLGIGKGIAQMVSEIKPKGYRMVEPVRVLSRDGLFRGDVRLEIEPPGAHDPRVQRFGPGRVLSVVHAGPWKRLGQAAAQLERQTKQRPRAYYTWYLTCPQCRKARGEKAVLFAHYG